MSRYLCYQFKGHAAAESQRNPGCTKGSKIANRCPAQAVLSYGAHITAFGCDLTGVYRPALTQDKRDAYGRFYFVEMV